jgi:carboxyl-terminal processing protease
MPRRNLYLLLGIFFFSFICYQQAEGQRGQYGRMFRTFVDVLQHIRHDYVEPVDDRKIFEGALSGMTSQLDQYSGYIPPKEYDQFQEDLGKAFGGVGIQVVLDEETNRLTVMSPVVGTPAYEAGILPGDEILEIDGESTEGFSTLDAVNRIRGEPGTSVRLTLRRPDKEEIQTHTLTRAEIHIDTVLGDTRNADDTWNYFLEGHPGIGYLRITSFSKQTSGEVERALEWLEQRGLKGLIIDVRNNPGGLLDSAVEIADLFVDEGVIVTTRGRDGRTREEYTAHAEGTHKDFPIVVLVNKYSASASEILAACLQDKKRATIIGERTWGKGSVQNVFPLEGGESALKLTIASYWRPSGKNIHKMKQATDDDEWGVKPDEGCQLVLEKEQFETMLKQRRLRDVVRPNGAGSAPPAEYDPNYVDPQLKRAVESLRAKIAGGE